MDFNLKQWKEHEHKHEHKHEHENESEHEQQNSAKIPRQLLIDSPHQNQQQHEHVAALPLFQLSQPNNNKITTLLSSSSNPPTAIPTSTTLARVGGGRYTFSITQWQELELQALIYRHMVAGASVPPELLQLVKKSLFTSSTPPFYLHHYQPPVAAALLQAGYWGKGALDPEPGRCRRTDGKKWRCSRDVVAGHKYCERHMHRGRNRSRKPVESSSTTSGGVDALVSSLHKPCGSTSISADTQFSLSTSRVASPLDAFQLNPGSSERKSSFGPQLESWSASRDGGNSNTNNNNKVLMHFFDDYPRSENTDGNMASTTSLSISTPGNSSSDFLRLSTGNGEEVGPGGDNGWGGNPVGSMGGPLAEALRSSSNSSPTSVLHQLPRCSGPDTSFVSA